MLVQAVLAASGGKKRLLDELDSGVIVHLYKISNNNGVSLSVADIGGAIVSLNAPNRSGDSEDIVLGYDNAEQYLASENPYFGSIVGRFANRIAEGNFSLDGKDYELATNNGSNHLHGGEEGFNRRIWKVELFEQERYSGLKLSLNSPDGDQGYPGALDLEVTYTLTTKTN